MKKLVSLLLALMLLCTFALAEVIAIPGTDFKVDIGALHQMELDPEDLANDLVYFLYNDEETVLCEVYVVDNEEGVTIEDMEAEFAEDPQTVSLGRTTINGIEALYCLIDLEVETDLSYCIFDGDKCVIFIFWYADDAAAAITGDIMNTLTK